MAESLEVKVEKISNEDIALSLKKVKRRSQIAQSIGAMATTGLFLHSRLGRWDDNFVGYAGAVAISSLVGFLMYGLSRTVLSLRQNPLTHLRDTVEEVQVSMQGECGEADLELRKKTILTQVQIAKSPLDKLILTALHDMWGGKSEEAIKKYVSLQQLYEQQKFKINSVEFAWQALIYLHRTNSAAHGRLEDNLEYAFVHMFNGAPFFAHKRFKRVCKLNHSLQIPVNCLYGYFLDGLKRNSVEKKKATVAKKAKKQWKNAVKLILEDPSLQFKSLGVSRNPVLEIEGPEIIEGAFIFKRNEKEKYLKQEYKISKFTHDAFQFGDEVPEPFDMFEVGGSSYFVLKRLAGNTLAESADESSALSAVSFLQRYHAVINGAKDTLPRYDLVLKKTDYLGVLKRVAKRITKNDASALEDSLCFVFNFLQQEERSLIHGDAHEKNLWNRGNGFSMLDPERMQFGVSQVDLAMLLDSPSVYAVFPESEQAVSLYHDLQGDGCSAEEFSLKYAHAGVANNVIAFSAYKRSDYGLNPDELLSVKKHHKKRGIAHLERIAEIDESLTLQVRRATEVLLEVI